MIVSTSKLAQEFGRTDRYVRELVKFGMPRVAHGKYDLAACKSWYIRYLQGKLNRGEPDPRGDEKGDDFNSERERTYLTKVRREKVEHDLAAVRGEYVPITLYERTMRAQSAQARQLLLTLPERIAQELEGQSRSVIKDILTKRLYAAMTALSKGRGQNQFTP